jgi:hypothetical protein
MDIREIFSAVSEHLLADFRKTTQIVHSSGKGSAREDALIQFFKE